MSYKVCYITTLPGTLKSFVLNSALYNIENGNWDVTFICDRDDSFAESLPSSIKYIPVDMPRGLNFAGIRAIPQLIKIFKQEKFDLIQYATSNAGCYAAIAGKIAKVPIRMYCQWGLGYVQLKGIRRFIFGTAEKIICHNSTHIRPDSNSNLEIGIREKLYDRAKSCVIGNGSSVGVDLDKFDCNQKEKWNKEIRTRYNVDDSAYIFGYVGRLLGDKGLNELFDAFELISKEQPNTYLFIVGSLSLIERISKTKLEKAKANPKVVFTDRVNDVEKYYAAFNCTVLPSYHEGLPNCVLESQAMKTPVIVTDVPGCVDAVIKDKTGFVVEKQNYESLYNAMLKMYSSEEESKKLGEQGYIFVKTGFNQNDILKLIYDDKKHLLDIQ